MNYPYPITWRGIDLLICTDRDGITSAVASQDGEEGAIKDDILPMLNSEGIAEIEAILRESLREDAA